MVFIPTRKESGEDRSADAVPSAADGAWKNGEGLGGKECGCQYGTETGVLHTDLDGERAFFGNGEASGPAGQPTEQVAERVMAENDGKRMLKEFETASHKIVVNGRKNAADDASEADDAQSRHKGLDDREAAACRIEVVQENADGDGQHRHDQDIQEHCLGVDIDDCAGCQFDEQGSQDGGEEG